MNFKNRLLCPFLCLALLSSSATAAPLRVVTTTSDLANLARCVGGKRVQVESLQDGSYDPHFLQARPGFIALARNADLWIRVGLELEVGYEPKILEGGRNPRILEGRPGHLDASAGARVIEVLQGKVDRSMGDVHPLGNPHYWLDPWNGRVMAKNISQRLAELDAEGAESYHSACTTFQHRLDVAMFGEVAVAACGGADLWEAMNGNRLDAVIGDKQVAAGGWVGLLSPHRGQRVATQHRSWNYLLDRFGLVLATELEPKPGIPPSSAHLETVKQKVAEQRIRLILLEPFYDRRAADRVAEKTGIPVLVAANASGGSKEARDYLSMLDAVIHGLADLLAEKP